MGFGRCPAECSVGIGQPLANRRTSPEFQDPNSAVLAVTIADPGEGEDIFAIFNIDDQALAFQLPNVIGRIWHRAFDTSLPAPTMWSAPGSEEPITGDYFAAPRSVVGSCPSDGFRQRRRSRHGERDGPDGVQRSTRKRRALSSRSQRADFSGDSC